MSFTNFSRALMSRLLTVLLMTGLIGCAQAPQKTASNGDQTNESIKAETPANSNPDAVTFIPSQNPYLEKPPTVNANLRKQFSNGLEAMTKEDWQGAIDQFDRIILSQSDLSGAHLNRGICLEHLEKTQAAKVSYETALLMNPQNVFALNRLGHWYRNQGQFNQAREQYQKALNLWPDYLGANKNMAILLDLYLHNPAQALPYYEHTALLIKAETGKEDRQVKGWIIDLKRRLKTQG